MLAIFTNQCTEERLARRLMAAVHNGHVRKVQVMLAMGADPNWPVSDRFFWSTLNRQVRVPVLFPLALVGSSLKAGNRGHILKMLLRGGASLQIGLAWFSAGPLLAFRLEDGLSLCELLQFSTPTRSQAAIVRHWLRQVSGSLNQIIPTTPQHGKELLGLHRRLIGVGRGYRISHSPAAWATAELL